MASQDARGSVLNLAIVSHKVCWRESGKGRLLTDGGFPVQISAIADLFDEVLLAVPVVEPPRDQAGAAFPATNLTALPLAEPPGKGISRKLMLPWWTLSQLPVLLKALRGADAVHAPIPGDVGTIGMLLGLLLGKPLFIRHCGNWSVQRTTAERFWHWFMVKMASTRHPMLATGGGPRSPSERNDSIRWIFATSLTAAQIANAGVVRTLPQEAPRLAIACRQESEKGTDRLIAALPLLQRRYPGVKLSVVGDGSKLPGLRQLALDLGVADRVDFHGSLARSEVLDVLGSATLFCYPTRASEGFPKVVTEAMACGLPIVSTPVSVLPHLISQGCGALLVSDSPEDIVNAVDECLREPEAYQRMSECSRRLAATLSLERWQEEIAAFLVTCWGPTRGT